MEMLSTAFKQIQVLKQADQHLFICNAWSHLSQDLPHAQKMVLTAQCKTQFWHAKDILALSTAG